MDHFIGCFNKKTPIFDFLHNSYENSQELQSIETKELGMQYNAWLV